MFAKYMTNKYLKTLQVFTNIKNFKKNCQVSSLVFKPNYALFYKTVFFCTYVVETHFICLFKQTEKYTDNCNILTTMYQSRGSGKLLSPPVIQYDEWDYLLLYYTVMSTTNMYKKINTAKHTLIKRQIYLLSNPLSKQYDGHRWSLV